MFALLYIELDTLPSSLLCTLANSDGAAKSTVTTVKALREDHLSSLETNYGDTSCLTYCNLGGRVNNNIL